MTERRVLNIDAARAARTEVERPEVVLVVDGEEYAVRSDVPVIVAHYYATENLLGVFECLFGDRGEELASKLTMEDLSEVMELVSGLNLPESAASGESSSNGGTSSRRTSNGSTGSTSAKRFGGKKSQPAARSSS